MARAPEKDIPDPMAVSIFAPLAEYPAASFAVRRVSPNVPSACLL